MIKRHSFGLIVFVLVFLIGSSLVHEPEQPSWLDIHGLSIEQNKFELIPSWSYQSCDSVPTWYEGGRCLRCRKQYSNEVRFHSTPYEWSKFWINGREYPMPSRGIIALCETCWSELVPAQRLIYYKAVYSRRDSGWVESTDWSVIKLAVLTEDPNKNDLWHKALSGKLR